MSVSEEELEALNTFAEAAIPYYQRYLAYVPTIIDPESPGHPNQMKARGRSYRSKRKQRKITREQLAKQAGIDPVLLACFETGIVPPADLPADFIEKLESGLG